MKNHWSFIQQHSIPVLYEMEVSMIFLIVVGLHANTG